MSSNDAENVLNVLAAIRKQTEKEEVIRVKMLEILNQEGVEDDDEIPQNFNFGNIVRNLVKTEEDVFSAIRKTDLDYLEIGGYICFKVDDESSGVEEIYFISPAETLYLESGCLSIF